jgi:hypothetical protein
VATHAPSRPRYFGLGETYAAPGTQLAVDVVRSTPSGSQLRFRVRNLENLGWNGQAPLRFREHTQGQTTVGKGQVIHFMDETAIFTGTP